MRKLLAIGLIFLGTSCATDNENIPQEIDTDIEKVGKSEDGDIGYNKDGEVIIQDQKDPAHELMIAKRVNQNLFNELERDAFALDHCIQEYSDPKLRGDGKFKNVDDYESLRPKYDSTEKLGKTKDGKLAIVKRSYLVKELKQANGQQGKLRKTLRFVQKELRKCEVELKFRKEALKSQ